MFKVAASSLATTMRCNVSLLRQSRATYIRGYWPEPITQQTLGEFLEDINYFDEPKDFVNVGLEKDKLYKHQKPNIKRKIDMDQLEVQQQQMVIPKNQTRKVSQSPFEVLPAEKVDEILDMLSVETEVPPLNYDDTHLEGEQLIKLAVNQGIYRDLFGGKLDLDRGHINFTPEQARRLDKLVPFFWITDQPFARVIRQPKTPPPVTYFTPAVGIAAKFVHENSSNSEELYGHTSYYGNIIPAKEALCKPSITLDGHLLAIEGEHDNTLKQSQFNNWQPGLIEAVNFNNKSNKYYSIAFVNLDHLHDDSSNLHWLVANINPTPDNNSNLKYDELCDYLPVHGINGFGYSRYVFVVLQHDQVLKETKIEGFNIDARKFNLNLFLDEHKSSNIVPVGLSWFQTTWDESSNAIFHNYLDMKSPVFEHVQDQLAKKEEPNYPGKVSFNIFMDYHRDKKKINEQVLLERLKTVDPFDYKDQYVPPRVPPTVFTEDVEELPDWMKNVMFKKKNKVGYWRGLRPASALLPLDNNADLDYPLRPVVSSKKSPPEHPNPYPARQRKKSFKEMPISKPPNEHQAVFVQDDHEVHLDWARKTMESKSASKK